MKEKNSLKLPKMAEIKVRKAQGKKGAAHRDRTKYYKKDKHKRSLVDIPS